MAEIENLKIGNGGTLHIVGNEDIVANAWQAGKTYVKNKSYVIREHRLYVCNVTHTSVEPFDTTKWTEITVGEAIAANTTAIGDLSQLTTSVTSSLVGAVNEVNKKESETLTYASGGLTASFKFSRFGNMVCVSGSGGAMPLPTSWTNLTGTLSANFRPSTALSLALITGDNHLIFLEVNTNGTVRVYSNYSGNLYPSGTGIYVTT